MQMALAPETSTWPEESARLTTTFAVTSEGTDK